MSSCYFFSWNLGANTNAQRAGRAFELAVKHLATQEGEFIAALQEVPNDVSATLTMESSNFRVRPVERTVGAKVMLLHSANVRTLRSEKFSRTSGAAFASDVWGDLQVMGVHIDGHLHGSPSSRQDNIRTSVGQIVNWWRGGPLVVLGDFNADPYHMEMCASESGFYALRDRDIIEWSREPTSSRKWLRFPLYNPMWRHLQEKNTHLLAQREQDIPEARGTNKFTDKYGELSSRVYDQILVSRDLMDKIVDGPNILSTLEAQQLITPRDGRGPGGYPKEKMCDHLPITMKIDVSNR